jgi:glycosyltransferase involved in cell wall biosynthesis
VTVRLAIEAPGTGGTEGYVHGLARYLSATLPVEVVTLDGDDAGVRARFPDLTTRAVRGPRGLYRLLARHSGRPGVASLHLYTSLLPAAAAARAAGAATVATLHIPLAQWNLRHRLQWRTALRLCHGAIGVSHACLEGFGRSLAGKPTAVAPGVLPFDRLPAARSVDPEAAGGALHVAAAGRLAYQKDWPTLLRAVARTPGTHLTLIGGGPDEAALRALAGDLGADVTFAGQMDQAGVFAAVQAADAFVLPSRFEGLPLAAMEAMALGVPTVTADFSSARELIEHEATGLRFPVGNADALSDRLARLRDDPALRDRLGATGARFARTTYRPEVQYAKYVDLMDRIAAD